jgi:K+-transporting ATPase KdpF subunit
MTTGEVLTSIVSVLLSVYLIFALLRGEKL